MRAPNDRVKLGDIDLHDAAAKALAIGEADMDTDVDAARHGELDGALQDQRIVRMKAASQVGRRQHVQERGVVAHALGSITLGKISVKVDVHGQAPARDVGKSEISAPKRALQHHHLDDNLVARRLDRNQQRANLQRCDRLAGATWLPQGASGTARIGWLCSRVLPPFGALTVTA